MTYLFDPNAWLRFAEEPEKISTEAHRQLQTAREPAALSAISVWEVSLKLRKGKLRISMPLDPWLNVMLRPSFVRVVPIDAAIARLANELPGDFHDDPADRLIAATALHLGLTVVTSDHLLIDYTHIRTLDTR